MLPCNLRLASIVDELGIGLFLLMPNLRFAYISRRRMIRNLAFNRRGCVDIVEEAS